MKKSKHNPEKDLDLLRRQRKKANDRERKRTKTMNEAFKNLWHRIPKHGKDRNSKFNVLESAVDYIRFLNEASVNVNFNYVSLSLNINFFLFFFFFFFLSGT